MTCHILSIKEPSGFTCVAFSFSSLFFFGYNFSSSCDLQRCLGIVRPSSIFEDVRLVEDTFLSDPLFCPLSLFLFFWNPSLESWSSKGILLNRAEHIVVICCVSFLPSAVFQILLSFICSLDIFFQFPPIFHQGQRELFEVRLCPAPFSQRIVLLCSCLFS